MNKVAFKTVDEYLRSLSPDDQINLERIRQAIKEAVPEAEEALTWQMPAFKLKKPFVNYAAFTHHYSLFVRKTSAVPLQFKAELSPYQVNGSTIQFRKSEPIPLALIGRMMEAAARETLG